MGSSQAHPSFTEDLMEDYTSLTYLSRGEIMYLWKKFSSIDPKKVREDFNYRFHMDLIADKFQAIKNNPFQDRLFRVFSSQGDGCFSFEDLLDLCSVMSPDCSVEVKAEWAFRVFDLDEDNQISERDVKEIVDRLTGANRNEEKSLDNASKEKIAKVIVEEFNLDNSGSISLSEFKFIMSRIPEFESSFYFRL